MAIKLSEEEIKNLEELINSDDIECVMLASEIISTLDEELQLKYQVWVYSRMLNIWFKNSSYQRLIQPPWFFD